VLAGIIDGSNRDRWTLTNLLAPRRHTRRQVDASGTDVLAQPMDEHVISQLRQTVARFDHLVQPAKITLAGQPQHPGLVNEHRFDLVHAHLRDAAQVADDAGVDIAAAARATCCAASACSERQPI
jgi:hypothetical protein